MRKSTKRGLKPPVRYGPRVESWIRASHWGMRGVDLLLSALMLQQTWRWKRQRKRMRLAIKAFEEAANWTRIAQNAPSRPPDPTAPIKLDAQ
jgi:hypothetical protein